jgi:acyl-CoA reductase-like NAD-dependent aldehyde dehydrogenase
MKFSFETDKILIAGKWRNAENNETIDVFNPSTGEVLCKVAQKILMKLF